MIQSLYRDKQIVWLRACHDTIDCIVTVGKKVWSLAVARYSTSRGCDTTTTAATIWPGRRATWRDTLETWSATSCDTAGAGP